MKPPTKDTCTESLGHDKIDRLIFFCVYHISITPEFCLTSIMHSPDRVHTVNIKMSLTICKIIYALQYDHKFIFSSDEHIY